MRCRSSRTISALSSMESSLNRTTRVGDTAYEVEMMERDSVGEG